MGQNVYAARRSRSSGEPGFFFFFYKVLDKIVCEAVYI